MIGGLIPSNSPAFPNTNLVLSAGWARSQDNVVDIVLPSGVESAPATALDSGTTLAANAGYHVFVIRNPSTGDVKPLWSRSAVNPVMPSGYTQRRMVGGFLTDGGGNIRKGLWRGDGSFELSIGLPWIMSLNVSETPYGNPFGLQTLAVPQGLKIKSRISVVAWSTDAGNPGFYVICKDPDSGPVSGVDLDTSASFVKPAGFNIDYPLDVWTDSGGQIYAGAHDSASPVWQHRMLHIYMLGFTHPRTEVV